MAAVDRNTGARNIGAGLTGQQQHRPVQFLQPSVLHAAIIGVPDPRLGERNCLCVVPRPGQSVTLEEMLALLRGKVATYKLPESLEIFDALPFTPTGKLQRHRLAEWVAERAA